MKNQIIGFTIGVLLLIVGVAELIPAYLDHYDGHENYKAFLRCSVISIFFGASLVLINKSYIRKLNIKQTFMLTAMSWFFMSLFAGFPLYFSDLDITMTDAFFESVSGITATGSTVLSELDEVSHGVLLWRSLMQWMGGIGTISFAILILPFLRVGGMQLYNTESSDRSDKVMPRTLVLVKSLFIIYIGLTACCFVVFNLLGMQTFNALNHALTTIPTGGFSTHDASFGFYDDNPALQYAATLFMLASAIPYVLYVQFVFQGRNRFWKDEQFKGILLLIAGLSFVITAWAFYNTDLSFGDALRYSIFNVVSIVTTTGYSTTDYLLWGKFAVMFFFFIMLLGGCAGSTTGGIKIMRVIIATRVVAKQLKQLIYPNGRFSIHYQGRAIDNSVAMAVFAFLGVFVAANVILTIALSLTGLDFPTAISGAATALSNVGLGVGIIGPAGNFYTLPDSAKLLLCLGMLLGRLEVMTVLVLFRHEYWRT